MSDSDVTEAARQRLRELGFDKLAANHADAAGRALTAARGLVARRPLIADAAQEPVHVFRPGEEAKR